MNYGLHCSDFFVQYTEFMKLYTIMHSLFKFCQNGIMIEDNDAGEHDELTTIST